MNLLILLSSRLKLRSHILPLLLILLTACAPRSSVNQSTSSPELSVHTSDTNPACQIVHHAWGETELCEQPERIIALDPHALDLLLSLGIEPVGYAEDRRALVGSPELGQAIGGVKYLGVRLQRSPVHVGTWQTPSLETMLGLKPDLILSGYLDQSQYRTFSQIAPTLIPVDDWNSPKQWQENLLVLGQILNQPAKAEQAIDNYNQKIKTVKAELASNDLQTVLLLSMTGLDYIGIFNGETFAGAILEDLGFQLVVPEHLVAVNGEIIISLETLPQLNPDLIIVMASGDSQVEQIEQVWTSNPILRSQPTYQNNHVYFVDYQLWSRIQGAIAAELVITQVREMLLDSNETQS